MDPVRETEPWYLSKETNKYTEYELLPLFTPLLVPPIGSLPPGGRAVGKGQVLQSIAIAVENGKGREGWKIDLVGVGIEKNVQRDMEEARFQRYLGTRWQEENVTVNI